MTARQITQMLHSRSGGNLLVVVASVALAVAYFCGARPLPGESVLTGVVGLGLSLAACLATALVVLLTNKRFNILRADTALPAALFMTMLLGVPPLGFTFGTGNILALTMTGGAYLLFSTYGDPSTRRRVFLLFTVVTALAMTRIVYLYYLPVLLLGCVQMRIFNFKTFLAAMMGIITPPWIVLGSGLVDFHDIEMPGLAVPMLDIDDFATITMLAVTAFTVIAGVTFTSANLIKVYSYNSQTRAMNGFYTVLFLSTALLTIIDFNNLSLYLPLLMAMVSYQASHFFSIRATSPRSWIGIALFMAVYWGSYIWYTWFIPQNPA